VLWVEDHEGRASIGQRAQELDAVATLHDIHLESGGALEHMEKL
jgi:hypothetical protein